MNIKSLILAGLFLLPTCSNAAFQCGSFNLSIDDREGLVRVNGEKVNTQKVYYLGKQGDESNARWEMTLMPARDGNMYGYELMKRNHKAWLNVELIRTNMDQPRLIGSFDCHPVAH